MNVNRSLDSPEIPRATPVEAKSDQQALTRIASGSPQPAKADKAHKELSSQATLPSKLNERAGNHGAFRTSASAGSAASSNVQGNMTQFASDLRDLEQGFVALLKNPPEGKAAKYTELNKLYAALKELPAQYDLDGTKQLCYEDPLKRFCMSNEAVKLALAELLPADKAIEFSDLKNLPTCEAFQEGKPVALILNQMENPAHAYPVIICNREGRHTAIALDSLGQGAGMLQSVYVAASLVRGLDLEEILSLDVGRQATGGDCKLFSLEDLMQMATTSFVDDLLSENRGEWVEPKEVPLDARLGLIKKLPTQFMQYSQMAGHMKEARDKQMDVKVGNESVKTDIVVAGDPKRPDKDFNCYMLVRKIQLTLLSHKSMVEN